MKFYARLIRCSLTNVLFRLTEPAAGSIVVDEIDVSTVSLNALRSSICLIPQTPEIFSGTIRSNLDPFGEHSDPDMWEALKRASLCVDSLDDEVLGEFGGV